MSELPPRLTPRDSGDAWVEGPDGRRFWGRYGAAGLLVHDPAAGILLQHRAEWSHFGGTWGLPGGARHEGESAVAGAIREAGEEAGVPADALAIAFTSVLDLGFWSYETVVARAARPFDPRIGDAESLELRWVPVEDVSALPLHPGFGASWPRLRERLGEHIRVVVDAANVVGSRPDGWWKDRAGAAARLIGRVEALADHGVDADDFGLGPGRVWPAVSVVLEGAARAGAEPGAGGPAVGAGAGGTRVGDQEAAEAAQAPADRVGAATVRIVHASASGDDEIVAEVERVRGSGPAEREPTARASGREADAEPLRLTVVVTADRELSRRVSALGAEVRGPRWLLDQLDAADARRG